MRGVKLYNHGEDLIKLCNEKNKKIYEIVLEKESDITNLTEEEIRNMMNENLKVMMESSKSALNNKVKSVSGLIGGEAMKIKEYEKSNKTVKIGRAHV